MANLTLRDVPRELHRWIKEQASMHRRSVNQEVITLLEALRAGGPARARKADAQALLEIGQRCAALPELDGRSPDAIVGYDERGLPA